MVDINVGVKLNIQESSLRNLQQTLARTVSSVSPQLNLDIDERRLGQLITNSARSFKIDVNADISSAGKTAIKKTLREVTDKLLIREIGFDRAQLSKLKKQLQDQFKTVDVRAREVSSAKSASRRAQSGTQGEQTLTSIKLDESRKKLSDAQTKLANLVQQLTAEQQKALAFEAQLNASRNKQLTEEARLSISLDAYIATLKQRASKRGIEQQKLDIALDEYVQTLELRSRKRGIEQQKLNIALDTYIVTLPERAEPKDI